MVSVRLAKIEDAEAIAQLTVEVQQLHNKAHPDLFRPPYEDLFPAQKLAGLLEEETGLETGPQ